MFRFNKLKLYIFYFSIIFFIFLFVLIFNDKHIEYEDIINTRKYNNNLVTGIIINGSLCPFDKINNISYFSNKDVFESSDIKVKSIHDIDYYYNDLADNRYRLIVYSDNYYQFVDIIITGLPILNLYDLNMPDIKNDNFLFKEIGFDSNNSINNYVGVHFINYFDFEGYFINDKGTLSLRGASSLMFPKKSYKLVLENKYDVFDIKSEDKWVLDALYVDKSKVRNKLSSDIWNLINNNQDIDNNLNGDFVEIFLNNEYIGLYVLKEKVDKSVTEISDDGVILKSVAHINDSYIEKLKTNNFSIINNSFLNYEIKYYNDFTFDLMLSKMQNFYFDSGGYSSVDDAFIIDNYINYKIFVALTSGNDNVSYNQYYSMSDENSKILITPWDMDLTWGLFWNDNASMYTDFKVNSSYDESWMDTNIIGNMDDNLVSFLKKRYWELRDGVITMDVINEYLDSYKDLLVGSNAVYRDSNRWYYYDFQYEIEKIRDWANKRILFLDEYFK